MGDKMNTDFIITSIHRIILVDKDEYPEKKTVFKHALSHNELIFHFSGEADVHFNGKILNTKENTVRFLPKGDTEEYTIDRITHGECIMVAFDTDADISNEAFVTEPKNASVIGNMFKKIFSVWVAKNEGYYFECMALLYEIFSELQKSNYIPHNQYMMIKPALKYIEENFHKEKISVPSLAEMCGISESYLKKLFIKKLGISPSKYIIQLRINLACDLLRTKNYTVGEISDICRYDNLYYFSRQFKEQTGITPTEFKNKYKSSK